MKSVQLKAGKEKALLNRHPWIFSGAVKKIDSTIAIGDMVIVHDQHGNALALGHWCAHDGLVCRVFSFEPSLVPSEQFWLEQFKSALSLRKALGLPSEHTNGFRLIHGEGDGLSGLVVDIYGDHASIQFSNPGFAELMPLLSKFLADHLGCQNIFYEESFSEQSGCLTGGGANAHFCENGLAFVASIGLGQKTGHFLDQRDNRNLVSSLASGRNVLDAFSYTGGFSVYAAKGGASSVTSLDISKAALNIAESNIALNNLSSTHRAIEADCFNYLRNLSKDEYDLIILDPPAFAKSAHTVMRASRGYKDINLLAMKAIRSGGLLFSFSCSHHVDADLFKKIIFAAAKDAKRDVKIIKELGQGSDHVVSVFCPQSNYLKGLALYVV